MATSDNSFLGVGWHFPPTFAANGGAVEMVANERDIQESLQLLLATAQGERVMREDFGCDLNEYLFEEISGQLINNITNLITDSILNYEPRIDLEEVTVDESQSTAGLLLINLTYAVRSTNSRFNMVYPFYINEAVTPGA